MVKKCPICGIAPMIPLGFGYYSCRLVDMLYIPKDIELSLFDPRCLITMEFE